MSSSKFDRMSEGDWTCPDENCQNLNFARRTQCNRCGMEKPVGRQIKKGGIEIGKAAAEKSRGLFSADDWQCPKCGNVNWARRSTCNVCNAPKTGEEERTGFGGGYNEREGVEYVHREESDGEYDEFGRKKKKFRKADDPEVSGPSKEPEKKVVREEPKKNLDEEEDEDEDEDDEGDLSKYDLWGSDDEKESEAKNSKEGSKEANAKGDSTKDRKRRSSSSDDDKWSRDDRDRRGSDRDGRRRSPARSRSRSRERRGRR